MHIAKIVIENYKSFLKSDAIILQPGMNVIIGPNNSGKTALLEALSGKFADRLHKSERVTARDPNDTGQLKSTVEYTIRIEPDDLKRSVEILNWHPTVPAPLTGEMQLAEKSFNRSLRTGLNLKLKNVAGRPQFETMNYGWYEQLRPDHPQAFVKLNPNYVRQDIDGEMKEVPNGTFKARDHTNIGTPLLDTSPAYQLIWPLMNGIYRFDAERLNIHSCSVGNNSALASNAANLPEVLQVLSTGNHKRFERFNILVSKIFPSVKWVSAVTEQGNQILIKVWPHDPLTEREDLAIPLSECGTGIGQVLAILYVVITSNEPRVIIIDEPQSFLHPGAAKTLIEILKTFPQHQYIISTHSPEILTAANPSTITALRFEDGETKAESLVLSQTKELRSVFEHIGIRFGDVFFADDILWVEGPTEQKAFPLIIEKLIPAALKSRVSILPLVNTGDLKNKKQGKKNARLVFEIYKKLSGAHALAPPMVGVILDREESNQAEMTELRTFGDGKVAFISRRMFEDYLLDADAIAFVANQQAGFRENPLTAKEVTEWMHAQIGTGKYLNSSPTRKTAPSLDEARVLKEIDGARLLDDLFRHFSETRVEYRKTTHSIELTAWILESKPDLLQEVAKLLESILVRHHFPGD